MKSHPHPERPDRLRAIVASLSAAGSHSKLLNLNLFRLSASYSMVFYKKKLV